MATVRKTFQGIIFDLDGVLVDSRACVDAVWNAWCERHGIPFEEVDAIANGRRGLDVVREIAPHLDAEAEAAALDADELRLIDRLTTIPGAAALLAQLPRERWAIATSAAEVVARERLVRLGLPMPNVFVAAEMVTNGKPDPEVFLAAAQALQYDPRACVVIEDAPDGVTAARAAGCYTVGVLTWASPERLAADVVIADLRALTASPRPDGIELQIETW